MAAVEVKSFDAPDETRPFEDNGRADVLMLAGHLEPNSRPSS